MLYDEDDIKSYCGNCQKQFSSDIYLCPTCGSNLVNYNTAIPTEKFIVQDRWERHNRGFRLEGNKRDEKALKK